MTGASRRHSLITANLIREIGQQLKGRSCEVLSGDMRIWVPATGLYTYADVVAVCGEADCQLAMAEVYDRVRFEA